MESVIRNVAAVLPSIPYPPSREGRWSPVTSTINWCEEDYYATIYSAEIVNAMTNIMFVYLSYKGIRNCIRNGHDTVFLVSFLGYLIVGLGSFLFHSTLKYPMQLVDELSMIYTTCIMCYATFTYGHGMAYSVVMGISLLSCAVFITGYYHYVQDPAFHQVSYALLTAVVLLRSMYVMETSIRPTRRAKEDSLRATAASLHTVRKNRTGTSANGHATEAEYTAAEQKRKDERDVKILDSMWTMIVVGLAFFLGGFCIWNLDNMYCTTLRRWRREVGLPWGIVLEGHGWWHLGTGIGAYFYITWGIWLRRCLNEQQDEYELHWPSFFTSFPGIVKTRGDSVFRKANGFKKSN